MEQNNSWKRENESGHLDSSMMYVDLHNRYIIYVYIQIVAIVMLRIFLEELSVLIQQNCFCLLFAVCNFSLSIQLNFVSQSVLYSRAYLSDCYQFYLTSPTVFPEV